MHQCLNNRHLCLFLKSAGCLYSQAAYIRGLHGELRKEQWKFATLAVAARWRSSLNFTWPWLERCSLRVAIAQWFACPLQAVLIRAACSIAARPRSLGSPEGKLLGVLRRAIQYHVVALSIVTHISTDHMHNTACSEASFAEGCTYRRPGFNCVVKQLRFWLFKVDCEFKDCDLRVLRIYHTCIIYTLCSNNCDLREKSQFAIFKVRN